MADETKQKAPGKGAENTLNLLGTIAGLVGNLAFGPQSIGMDFGAPFKMAAQSARDKREQKGLMELLGSHPETASLMEHGSALADAGGLVNNMDLVDHPEIQGMVNGVQDTGDSLIPPPVGDVSGGVSSTPSGSLLSTLQSPAPSAIDVTSPEFLQKAAILRPDIAEKLLLSQSKENTEMDYLRQVLLGQQIANYETPAQKRQAIAEQRAFDREQTNALIGGRQKENQQEQARIAKAKITPKEEADFNSYDDLLSTYQGLLINLEQGVKPSYMKNLVGNLPGGERALQATDPEFALFRKNTEAALAQYQKAISGVAISEQEARRLRPTQPQAGDDFSVFKTAVENNYKKAKELKYIRYANAQKRGGDVSGYVNPEELRKYNLLREAYNTDLAGALKSPKIQALRKDLGIDFTIEVPSSTKGKK